jgi:hypothetical protein
VVVSAGEANLGYDGLLGVRRLTPRVEVDLKLMVVSRQR